MSKGQPNKRETRNAVFNIVLVFGLIFLQSWVADGIEGNDLFTWIYGGLSFSSHPWYWGLAIVVMITFGFGVAWLLYKRRRTFLPIQIQRIGLPDEVVPHAVLVTTMSHTGSWRVDTENDQLTRTNGDPVNLSGTLKEVLDRLAALGEREKFSWEQLLRAITKHAEQSGKPDKVVLLGSPGSSGTTKRFEECRAFIRRFFPEIPEDAFERKEADFDSLEDLIHVYEGVIRAEVKRKGEIMIDVTGGTKVVSIAAAMVTLEHPEIEFQYVETHDEKRIRSFNVTGGGIDIGGGT